MEPETGKLWSLYLASATLTSHHRRECDGYARVSSHRDDALRAQIVSARRWARQQMAEDYLQNTGMSIPDIALRLGYSETTSFHRKFKAATSKTPGDFRRQ